MSTLISDLMASLASIPRDVYSGVVSQGFDNGVNLGVLNTARALFRNDVPDSKAVSELQVIWGVIPNDARAALWDAKMCEAELSLAGWLQTVKGVDSHLAADYAQELLVPAVKSSSDLLALWKDPEKLAEAVGLA